MDSSGDCWDRTPLITEVEHIKKMTRATDDDTEHRVGRATEDKDRLVDERAILEGLARNCGELFFDGFSVRGIFFSDPASVCAIIFRSFNSFPRSFWLVHWWCYCYCYDADTMYQLPERKKKGEKKQVERKK